MIEPLTPEQAELVANAYGLVNKAIKEFKYKRRIHKNDLISAGTLGLIDAAKRFDKSKGYKFVTFAQHRIRGAIRDWMRSEDFLTRKHREQIKRGELPEIENFSLQDFDIVSKETSPESLIEADDFWEYIVNKLPKRDAAILVMFYRKHMTMKTIGEHFGVTEPAISFTHSRILKQLREGYVYKPTIRELILRAIKEGKTSRKAIVEFVKLVHPKASTKSSLSSLKREGLIVSSGYGLYALPTEPKVKYTVTGSLTLNSGVCLNFSEPTNISEIFKILRKYLHA